MLKKIHFIFLLFSLFSFGQSEQLGINYFDRGEYEKAKSVFEDILKKQPNNAYYIYKVAQCHQQLKQFDKAKELLETAYKQNNTPDLLIELGFNEQLQKKTSDAETYYKKALTYIEKNANYGGEISRYFKKKNILNYAYQSLELAQKQNSLFNFNYEMAEILGSMGKLNEMTQKMLDYSYTNQNITTQVQYQFNTYLADDFNNAFTNILKKELITRSQAGQDIYWNQFLSWFYIQQKEYAKAFTQEKAIYKRNPQTFDEIIQLAQLCLNDKDSATAQTIFEFILLNTTDEATLLNAEYYITKYNIENAKPEEYPAIKLKLDELATKYSNSLYAQDLNLLNANFYCFYLKETDKAKNLLEVQLEKSNSVKQKAKVKMELASQFVFTEKFNQAIIYFAQISNDLPNDELSHEASMKMAKTSFYKKDFDWAMKQAGELKKASSQLIANDAVELYLLISDHVAEDTLKLALQSFAKAELLDYQKKPKEALTEYLQILSKHKGASIEANTIYKLGKIYAEMGQFDKALENFKTILDLHKDSIFIDEALFYSALIYQNNLNNPEKAKLLFEQVVLNHPDSIYFTQARTQYRTLRGDKQEGI